MDNLYAFQTVITYDSVKITCKFFYAQSMVAVSVTGPVLKSVETGNPGILGHNGILTDKHYCGNQWRFHSFIFRGSGGVKGDVSSPSPLEN